MGRISGIGDGTDSPMDLFRYSAPGERDLSAGSTSSNSTAYFSIDGGDTNLGTWNNVLAKGDLGDWDGPNGPIPDDAYNASSNPGVINTISANDLTLMNVLGYDLSCFLAGTYIRTPDGELAIEELSRGDLVMTADGRFAPVAWIGRRSVRKAFADPQRVLPIRIKANALGDQVPSRDLLLSPDHAILVDDVLIQAGALPNMTSIVRETNVAETFTYYHVELDDHSLIFAENTPAETFIDNVDRLAFDNWDEHCELYPEGKPIVEMPYPRAKAHRQVPRSIRERLAARAALFKPRGAAA
jgi:Hint domain